MMIKSNRFTNIILWDLIKVLKADCLECVEGVLLDNALYRFYNKELHNDGYIAIYERFETTNSSFYYVEISDTTEDNKKLCDRWYEFQYNADQNAED